MKTLLALVSLITISSSSFATSIQPSLLEYSLSPMKGFKSDYTYVRIALNGDVHGGVVSETPGKTYDRKLATLTPNALQEIRILNTRVEKGAVVGPAVIGNVCKAISTQKVAYVANSRITLEARAVPCGVPSFNDTRSSMRLVEILNHYVAQLK